MHPHLGSSPLHVVQFKKILNGRAVLKVHRTSLAAQWLRLCASTAEGVGLIPDQGTKIPQATQRAKTKTKQCNPRL